MRTAFHQLINIPWETAKYKKRNHKTFKPLMQVRTCAVLKYKSLWLLSKILIACTGQYWKCTEIQERYLRNYQLDWTSLLLIVRSVGCWCLMRFNVPLVWYTSGAVILESACGQWREISHHASLWPPCISLCRGNGSSQTRKPWTVQIA